MLIIFHLNHVALLTNDEEESACNNQTVNLGGDSITNLQLIEHVDSTNVVEKDNDSNPTSKSTEKRSADINGSTIILNVDDVEGSTTKHAKITCVGIEKHEMKLLLFITIKKANLCYWNFGTRIRNKIFTIENLLKHVLYILV
jgi:hypothetical protein